MTSRAFFHYILAFTVLFASSFAVFHGSEHIAIGKTDSVVASLTEGNGNSFHSEYERHESAESDSSGINHSIESLCEACLLLSSLSAYSLGHAYSGFSPQKDKHLFFNLVHSERQAFQTYFARAPPSNA